MSHHLVFEISSWWHCGSGQGSGAGLNALVLRDGDGLPYLPGRTIKGLVRECVQKAEIWKHLSKDISLHMFGSETLISKPHPAETVAGKLTFANAVLDWPVAHHQSKKALAALFGELHATAIEVKTGQAANQSLRAIEVCVPVTLRAKVEGLENPEYLDALKKALPLLRGLGLGRNRGLGQVHVILEETHATS